MRRLLVAALALLLLAPAVARAQFGGGGFGAGTSLPRIQLAGTEQVGVNVLNFGTNISGSLSAGTLTLSIASGAGLTATSPVCVSGGVAKLCDAAKGRILWSNTTSSWASLAGTASALLQVDGSSNLAWQTSPTVSGTFTAGGLTANGSDINIEPIGSDVPSAYLNIKSLSGASPQDWRFGVTPGSFGILELAYNSSVELTIEPTSSDVQRLLGSSGATFNLVGQQNTLTSPGILLSASSNYGTSQPVVRISDGGGTLFTVMGDGQLVGTSAANATTTDAGLMSAAFATVVTAVANTVDAGFGGNAVTSDATQTNCGTYTVPTDTTAGVRCQIIAFESDESEGAYYERSAGARNASGTVAQIGATATTVTTEDNAAWDATLDVSGTTVRVRVTGAVDGVKTVSWRSRCQVTYGPQ